MSCHLRETKKEYIISKQVIRCGTSIGANVREALNAESKADYNRYIELHAPELRKIASATWGEQFVSFRTLMQVVH